MLAGCGIGRCVSQGRWLGAELVRLIERDVRVLGRRPPVRLGHASDDDPSRRHSDRRARFTLSVVGSTLSAVNPTCIQCGEPMDLALKGNGPTVIRDRSGSERYDDEWRCPNGHSRDLTDAENRRLE
jgi:hypothetical protein